MLSLPSITLAQINPVMGDLVRNYETILRLWQDCQSDLIVFPELVLCGYPPEDLVLKPFFLDEIERLTQDLVAASRNISCGLVLSVPWRMDDGMTYSAAHVIDGGRIVGTTAKNHLPNYGVFDEQRVFKAGGLPDPIEFRGHKLGVMICEDIWFADVAQHLKAQGAEILVSPNGSPYNVGKQYRRFEVAKARVADTGLPLLYVNQVGGQDELVFDGGSYVMDAAGQILQMAKHFEEDMIHVDWNASPVSYDEDQSYEIYEALKLGLRDYIGKNGFPGVVLGLSGGIDSALSAVVAVDALGADKVHAIMMPSEFTSQDSLDDAQELADNLGVQYDILPIKDAVATMEGALGAHLEDDIAHQNIQSRLRGVMLMAVSNSSGKMVLSTWRF